jgi:DUF917 family protein
MVIAMFRDVINLVEAEDSRPLGNADIEAGQKVAVFGVTGVANRFRNPRGVVGCKPILAKFDHEGESAPVR